MERDTMRRIREAVAAGRLNGDDFTPGAVNRELGIHWAGTFLPKHRVRNPGGETERFGRTGRGRYCLL